VSVMPSCREVAAAVSHDELATLSWWRRATVRWHLLRCEECRGYVDQLRAIGRAASAMYRGGGAASDIDRMVENILHEEGEPEQGQPGSAASDTHAAE